MYELLTPEEMAQADAKAIAGGISGMALMNKAGLAVADEIATRHPVGRKVAVMCGPGNNGGDGFVAARILRQRGYRVRIGFLGDESKLAGDAAEARKQCSISLEPWTAELIVWSNCIVDALFGAGLVRPITGDAGDLVAAMNASDAEITSVDLPSGVSGLDGQVKGIAVQAHRTVTFFRKKPGHCLLPGKLRCGIVRVVDIGIPDRVLEEIQPRSHENAPDLWRRFWSPPGSESHKYARGHCFAVSGPASATGAARLAARAALRSGAGLVTLASTHDALLINAAHTTAIMNREFGSASELQALLSDRRVTSVVIGPGLGLGAPARDKVVAALECQALVVLDADALTLFADDPQFLFKRIAARSPGTTVMTPHSGEFARLFPDLAGGDSDRSKIEQAVTGARRASAIMVLKGADTVVAEPDGAAIVNHEASPWLATAGSGDVLAGTIAGLGAQSIPGFRAAAMATYIHARAAEYAGPGLIAEDLVESIKPVIGDFDRDHREQRQPQVILRPV